MIRHDEVEVGNLWICSLEDTWGCTCAAGDGAKRIALFDNVGESRNRTRVAVRVITPGQRKGSFLGRAFRSHGGSG